MEDNTEKLKGPPKLKQIRTHAFKAVSAPMQYAKEMEVFAKGVDATVLRKGGRPLVHPTFGIIMVISAVILSIKCFTEGLVQDFMIYVNLVLAIRGLLELQRDIHVELFSSICEKMCEDISAGTDPLQAFLCYKNNMTLAQMAKGLEMKAKDLGKELKPKKAPKQRYPKLKKRLKKKMCRSFEKNGTCDFGAKCKFSHKCIHCNKAHGGKCTEKED